jgi:hypothetical protein
MYQGLIRLQGSSLFQLASDEIDDVLERVSLFNLDLCRLELLCLANSVERYLDCI